MAAHPVLSGSTPLPSARDERPSGVRHHSQPTDPSQERREQLARDRHFRQLERHRPRVMHHLGADLDPLLAQRRQRPSLHRSGQRQLPEEVGQVVGQGEQLQPRLIGLEPASRQPRPLQHDLALIHPLLGRAAPVVELDDSLGAPPQVGHHEPEPREQLARMPMPDNALVIRALLPYHLDYGDEFTDRCPTGSGRRRTPYEVAEEIARRLGNVFLRDEQGRRPACGGTRKFQDDPHWRDCLLFDEYLYGDNGAGLDASHQAAGPGSSRGPCTCSRP
jgi:hypothetical protein